MKEIIHNVTTGEIIERELSTEETAALEQSLINHAWHILRQERNARLADSDWTVATDSPVNVAAWTAYRQALRDLPANTTDPADPVWPTPPA
jgi:hypothetical protein